MPTTIDFNEIPIFAFFGPESRKALVSAFTPEIRSKSEMILTFGKEVRGIFIIVEGEVEVKLPHVAGPVARLRRGQCFGEMSLLDDASHRASADIVVATDTVKLFFCSVKNFEAILHEVDGTASAFYRGAALQLSARLRLLNSRINHELEIGETLLSGIIKSSEVNEHIAITKNEVEKTGERVVGKLIDIMPILDTLKKSFPASQTLVDQLEKNLETVFIEDAQNFDRISQQLAEIQQHFENLRRLANGGSPAPITGDKNLFRKAPN